MKTKRKLSIFCLGGFILAVLETLTISHDNNLTVDIPSEPIAEAEVVKALVVRTTERPASCKSCFNRPYQFLINASEICKTSANKGQALELMIVVSSAPNRRKRRDLVRGTWASVTQNNTWTKARYVFLLGRSDFDDDIRKESEQYKDIAMQDFVDSYENLTLKTLMGLEWYIDYCPQASTFMKTDDDVLVHVPNILHLMHHPLYNASHVHGRCHAKKRPNRLQGSKWFTPISQYPHATYPPYCGGYGYIMSRAIAVAVYNVSPDIPHFTWEDAYIGLCLDYLGVKVRLVTGFRVKVFRGEDDECSPYNQVRLCIAHGYKDEALSWVWYRCVLPDLAKDLKALQ